MPNSLRSRLKNLVYKGVLSQKDLDRIVIVPVDGNGDLISRQAVLDLIADYDLSMGQVVRGIHVLPPVKPQEPRWIPVSEKLPNDRDWYLGIFKEPDTGWINPLPFICDYVGNKTKATTKEHWILRGFTDRDERIDYYVNLECVAWMPLPEPYKAESEGEKHHLTKQSKMVTDDKAQRKEEHI
jgi:hypothetical protein